MSCRALGLLLLILGGVACRPSAPPVYVPTEEETARERAKAAEDVSDFEAALRGYTALCEQDPPYVRACFDRVRVLFKARPVAEARRETVALIERFTDDGLTQSAVKRLAGSYSGANAHGDGIDAMTVLGERVKGTDIHDTVLFAVAKLARGIDDRDSERMNLELLVSEHGRWESQLWDDAVWRLANMARESGDTDVEKKWIRLLIDADESSWWIGSYTTAFHDDALIRLGHILLMASESETAVEVFDTAAGLESSRRVDDALLGAAQARIVLRRFREACDILSEVTTRNTSRRHIESARLLKERAACAGR
jgi:tetratricopeptide (TPR) repeat protein